MSEKIKDLILEAEKNFGKGSLKFGDEAISNVPIICSSGSLKMDLGLGCNGIPQSRMIEYFGPPSGGKSTLAIITMSEAQKKYSEKVVSFIDLENSFDRTWATNLGLDCSKILFSQPDSGEEAFSLIEMMIKSNEVSFIVVDSISGLLTRAQLEAGYDEAQMTQLARLMSQSLPKINNILKDSFCTILFINQTRQKIGSYGNPEDTQGGNALKFWASIRAEIRRGEVIGDKDNPSGFITKIKILKNKVGPPFRKIETELFIGPDKYGIDKVAEIADLAIVNGIIKKSGAWFSYNDERLQGRENLVNMLRANEKIYNEIFTLVSKTVLKNDAPIIGSFQDIINSSTIEEITESNENKRRSKKLKDLNENLIVEEVNEIK